jgi:hypothetical protein
MPRVPGTRKFHVRAADAAGNLANSEERTLTSM